MPVGMPKAAIKNDGADPDVEIALLLCWPIRAGVALSVFMFGMLGGAGIAAWVMPPV